MAMMDYGAILAINNEIVNEGQFFMDMQYEVGFTIDEIQDEDYGNLIIDGNFFVYFGDRELLFCVYKTMVFILSNEKIVKVINYKQLNGRFVYNTVINDVPIFVKRIGKDEKYVIQLKYKGHKYECIYGYGIDSSKKVYQNISRKGQYGYTKKTIRFIDRFFNKKCVKYRNGLPLIKKAKLGNPLNVRNNNQIWKTNLDEVPYILQFKDEEFSIGEKYSIKDELYTLKSIDAKNNELTFKIDKVINLTERTLDKLIEYYKDWGINKKVKVTHSTQRYRETLELDIEGKLNKKQIIKLFGVFYKIVELNKNNGVIEIVKENLDCEFLTAVYPYKERNVIKDWYFDIGEVWLRQAKEAKPLYK